MMKTRTLTFLMALCLVPFFGWSQQTVKSLEFEIGGGLSIASKNKRSLGSGQFFLELRSNLPNSKFDVGMQFCLTGTFDNEYSQTCTAKFVSSIFAFPLVDYNFFRGERISYFIGSGIGMMTSRVNDETIADLAMMPRAGVEFFNRLRITLDYKWNPQGRYNYAGINFGFVFGGGRKK